MPRPSVIAECFPRRMLVGGVASHVRCGVNAAVFDRIMFEFQFLRNKLYVNIE